MNEELVRSVLKIKFNLLNDIVDNLPVKLKTTIKAMEKLVGETILESIDMTQKDIDRQKQQKDGLKSINIE